MTSRARLLALSLLLAIGTAAGAAETTIAFRGATVIDIVTGRDLADATVVVRGHRIIAVGRASRVRVPRGAQVVEAGGKFIIPGLWDMHVHMFGNRGTAGSENHRAYFPRFLANGVTGVRDGWSDPADQKLVRRWREDIEAGRLLGPRVVPASSMLDGVPVVQRNARAVVTADDARRAVREEMKAGAGYIKVYERLSREAYFAIAGESKQLHIPFAGHVPVSVTVLEASAAGQKSIEHSTGLLVACSSSEAKFVGLEPEEWTPAHRAEVVESFDEQACRKVARTLKRNGTWLDPTLVETRAHLVGDDERIISDARLENVPAGERAEWMSMLARLRLAPRERRLRRFALVLKINGIMHDEGVGLLAGTDLGNEFIYAGSSIHDELELFVEAGLTPLAALRTATINPVRYLELEKTLGSVTKGKLADFVLLDADPRIAIANSRSIFGVVANGRYLARQQLSELSRADH